MYIDSYKRKSRAWVEPDYTPQDIVFTSKGGTVYAICLAWPEKEITVKSFAGWPAAKIQSVTMLGVDQALDWKITDRGLTVQPPREKPCNHAFVFKINTRK